MSELELLPCPFCGGEAKIATYDWGHSVKEYWIYCNPCDCASGRCHSKEGAINAWNTRTPMANILKKLEELPYKTNYSDYVEKGMVYKYLERNSVLNIVKQEINNGLE